MQIKKLKKIAKKNAKKKTPAQNVQLRRCLTIIKALTRNRYGLTKGEIFDILREHDIEPPSVRTFVRDINELRSHGYEILCGAEDFRYKLENREEVISEAFSFEEIQALQMCRDLFTYFDGTHLKDSIDAAIDAVIGSQKTRFTKDDIEECRENFMVRLGWRRDFIDKREMIDTIAYGVNNETALAVTYKKPNQQSETITLEPYKIVLYHDSLYLLAKRASDKQALRLYHISRFENVCETSKKFKRNSKLIRDYETCLENCFGIFIDGDLCDVEIDFDKSVEYMLRERLWHKSQSIESRKDKVILKLRVYKSGEFLAWIKSWGDRVLAVRFRNLGATVAVSR